MRDARSFRRRQAILQTDPKSRRAAANRMVAMMRAGRVPGDRHAFPFWQVLLAHAEETVDPDLFETALTRLRDLPGVQLDRKWLFRMEKKLQTMRVMKKRDK